MPEPSRSGVLEGAAVDTDRPGRPDPSPPIAPDSDQPTRHGDEFDTLVEEIRRWYGWDYAVVPYLADQIRRRLGLAPLSATAVVLAGLIGVGIRLALVLVATAVVGQWAGIPWGRWAVILAFYAAFDASRPFIGPPVDVPSGPGVKRIVEGWTPLLPTIVRESDLRDLAGFLRRWSGPMVSAALGVVVATFMLTASWWLAPAAMGELPVGTIVLLAWLLFDFGATVIFQGVVVQWAFMAREARYDHHLFWPSPADSPEVKKAIRKTTSQGSAAGFWITVILVLTVILVTWDSPLVVPLGAGFILIGYLATFGAALSGRGSVQRIVHRVREQRLRGLRERIDGFEPDYTDLSPQESQQLRDLLFLHDKIRDAPTTPTTTRTVVRTAVGLTIPTIMFLATVFGEVYAERFLDAILS
jgi:hypothetical protein